MRKYSYKVVHVNYNSRIAGKSKNLFLEDTLNSLTANGERIVDVIRNPSYTGQIGDIGFDIFIESEA